MLYNIFLTYINIKVNLQDMPVETAINCKD